MLSKLSKRFDSLLLTIWVGGILVVGYIVAPVLFATLDDRSSAALVAGKLFSIMGLVGLYCGSLLLFMVIKGDDAMRKYRPLLMLWLVIEIAARFAGLPVLYVVTVYLVVLAVMLRMQIYVGYHRYWQFWALCLMLVCTAIGYFFLAPNIEAMRLSGEAARASGTFKLLHGSASVLYLLTSLCGLALVLIGMPQKQDR